MKHISLIGAVTNEKFADAAATAASGGPAADYGSNATPIPTSSTTTIADARSSANISRLFIHRVNKFGSETTGLRAKVNAPFSLPSRNTWKHNRTQFRSRLCGLSLCEKPAAEEDRNVC